MFFIEEQLRKIADQYKIAALYVFGSRAAEIASRVYGQDVSPQHPDSDVDIGVQPALGQRLSARERVRLAMALEDLLGVKRVDLVVLPEADPFLAVDIVRGRLLYGADADAQAEDELYVLRRAGDLAPYASERWKHVLAGTAP